MQTKNKTNSLIIASSFLLIILVAIITFSRSYFSKNTTSPTNTSPSEKSPTDVAPKDQSQLSSAEVLSKINSAEKTIVLDMRDPADFEQSHIIDSKNITLQEVTSSKPLVDKSATYILINDGNQENLILAKNSLMQKGASRVFYLNDSFQNWKDQNYPTISIGDPESFIDKAKVKYVQSDEFNGFINTEKNLLIIDVRSNENYKIAHIKGAINIPLSELEARRHEIPIGRNIVLYDQDGLWAFQGAVRLFDLGFANTLYLSDGFDTWKTKNYPIEK